MYIYDHELHKRVIQLVDNNYAIDMIENTITS